MIQETVNKNSQKIPISDLFCACDNISKNAYYCIDSQKNIFNRCIGNERDHINHTIIDFKDDKIETIIVNVNSIKLNKEETEEKKSDEDDNYSRNNSYNKNRDRNSNNELEQKKEL